MAQQLTQALLKGGAADGGLLQGDLWQVRPVGAGDGGQDCSGLPLQAGRGSHRGRDGSRTGWLGQGYMLPPHPSVSEQHMQQVQGRCCWLVRAGQA